MKMTSNIGKLRKRFGIKDDWGLSDTLVRLMAECPEYDPKAPVQSARNHVLRPTFPSKFYRDRALNLARMAEEQPELASFIVLGQIIEYHTLADWLSGDVKDLVAGKGVLKMGIGIVKTDGLLN